MITRGAGSVVSSRLDDLEHGDFGLPLAVLRSVFENLRQDYHPNECRLLEGSSGGLESGLCRVRYFWRLVRGLRSRHGVQLMCDLNFGRYFVQGGTVPGCVLVV